jgi:hypothetical protein
MMYAFVSVGLKYSNILRGFLDRNESIKKDSIVLTNNLDMFHDVETIPYKNKIFSYFDKLLHPLRMVEQYRDNVLYIDADELFDDILFYSNTDIDINEKSLVYLENWPQQTLGDLDDKRFGLFKEMVKIDHMDIETIKENFIYFPKSLPSTKLIWELEVLKPIFETLTILHDEDKSAIGNGEGVALSYLLKNNNIKTRKLK